MELWQCVFKDASWEHPKKMQEKCLAQCLACGRHLRMLSSITIQKQKTSEVSQERHGECYYQTLGEFSCMDHCIRDLNESHFIKLDCSRVWITKIISFFRERSLYWCQSPCLARNKQSYLIDLVTKEGSTINISGHQSLSLFPSQSVNSLRSGQGSHLQLFQLPCKGEKKI